MDNDDSEDCELNKKHLEEKKCSFLGPSRIVIVFEARSLPDREKNGAVMLTIDGFDTNSSDQQRLQYSTLE